MKCVMVFHIVMLFQNGGNNMKKDTYYVLQGYSNPKITPTIIFQTSIAEDAIAYANICQRANPEYTYGVAKISYIVEK